MLRNMLSLGLILTVTTAVFAGKNAELKPKVVKTGKLVVEDAFDRSELRDNFAAAKGDWTIVDGILTGKELATDKHAAVLTYQHRNRDSVVQFSFMLDGIDGFNFSMNHAKGHLFRVIVSTEALMLRTDKDKKDPASKPILLDQAKGKISEGQWHTMLIEIHGDTVAAQIDNGLTVSGSHPSLDVDKPNYRFVMKGETLKIDDLKISEIAK